MNDPLRWWAEDFLRATRTPAEGPSSGTVAIQPGVAEVGVEGRGFRRTSVLLRAPILPEDRWEAFFRLLEEQALFSAALLAGYLPGAGRPLLASRNIRLIPRAHTIETGTDDAEIGATAHRALAAVFDEDPFRLLHFRGRRREQILARIEAAWASAVPGERAMDLGELEALLEGRPEGEGLLAAVQAADAFRETRVARAGLARLFGKVSERVAAMNRARD